MAQNLIVVMSISPAVVLSNLHAGFETQCPEKDFLIACLLLAACADWGCIPAIDYLHEG